MVAVPGQLLGVDVEGLARLRALAAGRTRRRLEPAEAPEAMAAQDAADGRDRQVEAAERAS